MFAKKNMRETSPLKPPKNDKLARAREGVQVETLLREGRTVQEILKVARDSEFELIVMGARGISKIREMLLGSVSDGVIRNAPCPVLVTK